MKREAAEVRSDSSGLIFASEGLKREGKKIREFFGRHIWKAPQGASIYDVRTDGGGGVSPKENVVREVA